MQKSNSTTALFAFIAILFGLVGVYAYRKIGQQKQQVISQQKQEPTKLTVPLASRDIPVGQKVTLSDVALVKMTREQMREAGITGMFMADPDQIIGSTVMKSIQRGKTFHTEQFFAEGFRPNVTERLQPGQRAITILVNSEDALNGYASAGQIVDLIFRIGAGSPRDILDTVSNVSNSNNSYLKRDRDRGWSAHANAHTGSGMIDDQHQPYYAATTVTLVQGVEILALENNTVADSARDLPDNSTIRVTVALTPEQAETVRAVEGHGRISLSLRNPADREIVAGIESKSLEDVLGVAPVPKAIQRRVDRMEVYRGSSVTRLQFDGAHPLAVRIDPSVFQNADQATEEEAIDEIAELDELDSRLDNDPEALLQQPQIEIINLPEQKPPTLGDPNESESIEDSDELVVDEDEMNLTADMQKLDEAKF